MRVAILFALLVALSLPTAIYASQTQGSDEDSVYLKNGSVVVGTIIEYSADGSLAIKTKDGMQFTFKAEEIDHFSKGKTHGESNSTFVSAEYLELSGFQGRKNRDLILISTMYGLTLLGDLLVGGDVFIGSAIPVVGPFINIASVGTYPGSDTDKALFALSGVLQTGFLLDYLYSRGRENDAKKKLDLGLVPHNDGFTLYAYYSF